MHGDSVPRVACVSRHFYAQAENDQVHEIPYNRGSMVLYVSCISFFRPVGRKNDIQTHLTQAVPMPEVWRAASPPSTLLFPGLRRRSLGSPGKGDPGEASPPQTPPLRKVRYKEL